MPETQDKDTELLASIWQLTYGCMYKTAVRILQNGADAEDAVMDAIERIAGNLEKFRGLPPENTCALSVIYARNIAIDMYRRRRREPYPMDLFQDEPDHSVSIEETAAGNMMTDMICALLETMPAGLRDVLNLHIHFGYSNKEIAAALHLRQGTVRTRLFRARAWLRARLKEKGVDLHM